MLLLAVLRRNRYRSGDFPTARLSGPRFHAGPPFAESRLLCHQEKRTPRDLPNEVRKSESLPLDRHDKLTTYVTGFQPKQI
jgi:hypothetical protein